MTRDYDAAQARQRRSEATEMRRSGFSLRAIAEALRCSLPEIHRLLKACVRGSPGLSHCKGVVVPSVPSSRVTQSDEQKELRLSVTGDALASAPSAGNAGAIVAAIVSEYAASAHSAQLESDVTYDGRGALGETNFAESPVAYIQRRIREIVATSRDRERPP